MDKIKLFIFSNAYNSRILLKYLECTIKNIDDFEIILLSELGITEQVKLNISVYDTLNQCIEACTQILIVLNTYIPKSKIDLVISLAKLNNKPYVTACYEFESEKKTYIDKKNNKPLILILSYGYHTELSCLENIVYKLLCEKDIKVFQTPSNELKNVMTWISLCNFKSDYFNGFLTTYSESDVEIRCLQYDSSINCELNNTIVQLNPDVIIVSVSNNFSSCEDVRNMIKYRCGNIVDAFVKSEALEIIDEIGIPKSIFNFLQPCYEWDSIISLNDPMLLSRLSQIILPKIIIPDNVMII